MRESSAYRYCTSTRRALRHITISLGFAVLLIGGCSSYCIHPPLGSISGRVVDPQDHAVVGVEVRLGDRLVGATDQNGTFVIRAVPTNDRLAVTFSAPKFMSTTRIYEARAAAGGINTVLIWPRATPARLRASEGGKLKFSGGTIVFPPDAFVDTKGRPVTGEVNVSMSVLDIADPRQLASAPGDFTAKMRDGSIRNLETFGLFELVIADDYGQRVDLARDRTARVELNVPKGRGEVPQSVGSFSFDQRSGRWVQRASTWQLQSSTLSTQLAQDGPSGWWNADQTYDTTCIRVRLLSCHACEGDPAPITGVTVTATGTDYMGGASYGTTIGDGTACLLVKMGAHVKIDIPHGNLPTDRLDDLATPAVVADCSNLTACPILTATHTVAAAFSDTLTAQNPARWCASNNYWNHGDFAVGWLSDPTHLAFSSSGLTLTLNDKDAVGAHCASSSTNCSNRNFASGEYKTECYHWYGTYTATIAPPAQPSSGIVTGFFTYTDGDPVHEGTVGENGTNGHDEIDFELLGRPPIAGDIGTCTPTSLVVQTNYFAKNVGLHAKAYCLPYGTYTYTFTWASSSITWSILDLIGTTLASRTEPRGTGPWPTQPGRVFLNLWANSSGAPWVGQFTYSGPRSAVFSNVSVP
jgi:hypothetical protein